ncbi:riboflavin kinase [Mycolicibacterium boenickei]
MTVAISSGFIRSRIAAGDVTAAVQPLGRPHRADGIVVHGDGRGRLMGSATANVE